MKSLPRATTDKSVAQIEARKIEARKNSPLLPMVSSDKMSPICALACLITKLAFITALIGLVVLSGALLLFSGFMNPGQGQEAFFVLLCGGVYIIGSLYAIGDRFSPAVMTGSALVLNVFGGVFSIHFIDSREPAVAVFVILLPVLWSICVILRLATRPEKYRLQATKDPLVPSESGPSGFPQGRSLHRDEAVRRAP